MTNLTALITGSSRGIGFEIAKLLSEDKRFTKIHCLARTPTKLDNIISHCIDISNFESVNYHLRRVLNSEPLNLLINCAGVCTQGLFKSTDFASIQKQIQVNLLGTMAVTHSTFKNLIANKSHIINISSLMGRVAAPTYSGYCSSKFGIVGFSESLRHELAPEQIKVSCVLPTLVETDMTTDKEPLNELIYPVSPQYIAEEIHSLLFKHEGLKAIGKQAELACIAERVSPFVKRFMF